jgi:hypothetical protein
MAKDKKKVEEPVVEPTNFVGKTPEELKEILQTLQTQKDHHQTMAIKAQGAIEVLVQLLPQEEKSEG